VRRKSTAPDLEIAKLAGNQHAVVAYRQLIALGLSRGAIQARVRSGRLHPIHRGVYSVGHAVISRRGELMAAVLACGPNAALSRYSAAELWELLPRKGAVIDVVNATRSRDRKGIRVHEGSGDRTKRHNIPVTTVARTLLDLATTKDLPRAIEAAERSGWLNQREIRELCERHPRRKGLKALRAAMAAYDPLMRHTRSELERDFLRECRRLGLPKPEVNVKVEGFEVDMFWREAKLIVELDSWEFHRTRPAFERDRRRDAALLVKGYRVLRVSYDWLATDPRGVAETIWAQCQMSGSIASSA
jgi:very-short-patch-repair endonuclease